jgi:predicted Rossmann fold flavoprotein
MKQVVVVGGGASGLTAAIILARQGKQVTLIERNNICGKKILITGNGRCNYWNVDQSISHYHSHNQKILKQILENDENILNFFDSLGIISKIKNGYYYPFSNQAQTIQNALVLETQKLNIETIYNLTVTNIIKKENFIINPNKENIEAQNIVLACGSKAAFKTGSDSSGYILAQQLGHTVIKPTPSLVQLKGQGDFFHEWDGVRSEVNISLYENQKFVKSESGEIQLTHYGISGICVFNLSGKIAEGLTNKKDETIYINFIPWLQENPKEWLLKQNKKVYKRTVKELLEGFLNKKIVNIVMKKSKIKNNDLLQNINIDKLIDNLANFKLPITGFNSFDQAQVCRGGIPLEEINPQTMESLKTKGLYLTGELLDVDGDCGGYNLGFAWTSGIIAGKNLKG